jgi:hypothetical protein
LTESTSATSGCSTVWVSHTRRDSFQPTRSRGSIPSLCKSTAVLAWSTLASFSPEPGLQGKCEERQ